MKCLKEKKISVVIQHYFSLVVAVGFCLGIAINEWIKARKADKRAELHASSDLNPAGQLQ